MLNSVINYNITLEIIGTWIWAFDSYEYRKELKELGFTYAPKKKAWTWHYGEYKRHHKKEIPIDDIRAKYGTETVRAKSKPKYNCWLLIWKWGYMDNKKCYPHTPIFYDDDGLKLFMYKT